MLKVFQTVGTGLRTVRQYAASERGRFSGDCLRRGTFLDRQEKYPKEADSRGSEPSAASGRISEASEWQRSTDAKAFHRRRQMSGTATGTVLTVKSIALPAVSMPLTPISSRPPLRIPPGRFASVKSSMFYSLPSNYNLSHRRKQGRSDCCALVFYSGI